MWRQPLELHQAVRSSSTNQWHRRSEPSGSYNILYSSSISDYRPTDYRRFELSARWQFPDPLQTRASVFKLNITCAYSNIHLSNYRIIIGYSETPLYSADNGTWSVCPISDYIVRPPYPLIIGLGFALDLDHMFHQSAPAASVHL